MENLAKRLNIRDQEGWYSLTLNTLKQNGGYGLLQKYNGSPSKLLTNVYPEYPLFSGSPASSPAIQLGYLQVHKCAAPLLEQCGQSTSIHKGHRSQS